LDAGMNDYITKPLDLEELYKKIIQFFLPVILEIPLVLVLA
jgi:CheY-like chemotaxis protein